MRKPLIALGLGVVLLSGAAVARMAQPSPALSPDSARDLAGRIVPGAEFLETELEEENGRLIYSIEMRAPDGVITEVEIDANTGQVIETEVETEDDDGEADDHDKDDA